MEERGAAAALRAVAKVAARQCKPDLVLSGLQMPGIFARDTRMVFDELLGSAERSVWLSSFVYYKAQREQARAHLIRRFDHYHYWQITICNRRTLLPFSGWRTA